MIYKEIQKGSVNYLALTMANLLVKGYIDFMIFQKSTSGTTSLLKRFLSFPDEYLALVMTGLGDSLPSIRKEYMMDSRIY